MALHITNPTLVAKIERLARKTGLSKTAVVEQAVDRLLAEAGASAADLERRVDSLLKQLDKLEDRPNAADPLEWDEHGLPR